MIMWLLSWSLIGIAVGMVVIAFLLYHGQRRLIYMPNFPPGSRTTVWAPDRFGMPFERLTITAADGIKTVAYYIPCASGKPSMMVYYCHANAGNMGHRLPIAKRVRDLVNDADVFMLSYRGYGESEGTADELGIKLDTQAGLEYILEAKKPRKMIVYGQSIGGAVAIDMVARNPHVFTALIVENTFTSIPDLIPYLLPVLKPLSSMCHQRWASVDSIEAVGRSDKLKMLILSGLKDTLIPPSHSSELYSLAKKNDISVELKTFPNGDHNDTVIQDGYFKVIKSFLESL